MKEAITSLKQSHSAIRQDTDPVPRTATNWPIQSSMADFKKIETTSNQMLHWVEGIFPLQVKDSPEAC